MINNGVERSKNRTPENKRKSSKQGKKHEKEVNNIGKSIWKKLTDEELKNKHYATKEAWRKNDKEIQIGDLGKPVKGRNKNQYFAEVPKITKRAEKDPDTEVVKGFKSYQRRFFKSKKKAKEWAKKWKKQL